MGHHPAKNLYFLTYPVDVCYNQWHSTFQLHTLPVTHDYCNREGVFGVGIDLNFIGDAEWCG
jgi:hypothetical protein